MRKNILQTERFHSPKMGRIKHIHFVGIGGVGMCGIAEMLHREGYRISGSDLSENQAVHRLRSLGINVIKGHNSENIVGADAVVQSTAISNDNPEIVAAKATKIPVLPRAAMLAELMRFRQGIAIAGTHGKTTTTSLVATLLVEGGLDPSYVVGGKVNSSGTNAILGTSSYCVVEADESDASFLFLKPMMAIVTNIDADHMSTYNGDFRKLCETFIEFLHHLPFYGLAVLCVDDPEVKGIIPLVQRPIITYGFDEMADFKAVNWQQNGMVSSFTVKRPAPHSELNIEFNWPGQHNVLNSLAAIAIATELGISDIDIKNGLQQFAGVGRRFQMLGERGFSKGKAMIIDDYGHHPREIRATIEAFRAAWPSKRLVHVFQPHRYTRTRDLFAEFVDVLSLSDQLLLLDIYSAGEDAIAGVVSENLLNKINEKSINALLINELSLLDKLDDVIVDGDVILMQGAGNVGQIAANLMRK
ncbi:MAG: UDP-N-acetylmuramate--L-alanine ligase [Legionellales bacterium RIFCSPHIGHO2_12_FULL_35_11]|nr:MAG: UDP-N-acetylmuramate--L-alanine ligase [Legionellales bacterium RIFCSPHIGHO2_12_FULL_35_11]